MLSQFVFESKIGVPGHFIPYGLVLGTPRMTAMYGY